MTLAMGSNLLARNPSSAPSVDRGQSCSFQASELCHVLRTASDSNISNTVVKAQLYRDSVLILGQHEDMQCKHQLYLYSFMVMMGCIIEFLAAESCC